ncbi:hypothetical protein [Geomicrobium sediminis]|uniref:Uncharacterized protein n=1 Tax=Geomicrobium sediminis TaxID=1347788 RepID=A0ABS2PFE0_9BACL|nr:hypothetical protein [Geomicrobium sediminis]MBM7634049.1 hypothetical protein [Geomicrobium sediminis]
MSDKDRTTAKALLAWGLGFVAEQEERDERIVEERQEQEKGAKGDE